MAHLCRRSRSSRWCSCRTSTTASARLSSCRGTAWGVAPYQQTQGGGEPGLADLITTPAFVRYMQVPAADLRAVPRFSSLEWAAEVLARAFGAALLLRFDHHRSRHVSFEG